MTEPRKQKPIYQGDDSPGVTRTEMFRPLPPLGEDERAILIALCSPILTGDAFTSPASSGEIAQEAGLAEADVEQRLRALEEKLGVETSEGHKRLALEAIRRGAVGLNDIRS